MHNEIITPKDRKDRIPPLAIPRLSLYYRALYVSKGDAYISSKELAQLAGVTDAQVRKDLTYFGQFGTPGRGYLVVDLRMRLLKILGADRNWDVALVGAGNLGSALLSYNGFRKQGFNITCVFDKDARKIGKAFKGIKIQGIGELKRVINEKSIRMAIVTIPADSSQVVVDALVAGGVRAVLNFSPARPQAPDSVQILNIDLSIELEKLAHFLTNPKENGTFFSKAL